MTRQGLRIVVEGLDGSGKTTLITSLMHEFPQLEFIRNDLGPNQDFANWWPEQLERIESPRIPIHDRFFWSELIYGPVIRGHLAVSQDMINNVSWFLRSTCLLIYARPDGFDALLAASKVNEQMEGVHEKFDRLLEVYDGIMGVEASWMLDRFHHYDFENPDALQETADVVRKYIDGSIL